MLSSFEVPGGTKSLMSERNKKSSPTLAIDSGFALGVKKEHDTKSIRPVATSAAFIILIF
jgi:hypothetical protein